MKHQFRLPGSTALVGLLLAISTCALHAQTVSESTVSGHTLENTKAGILKSVLGDVQLLAPAGAARKAIAGDTIAPAERILTGANAGASLVLRDGTVLVVGPSSQLDVSKFNYDSTTQLGGMLISLLKGSVRTVTGLMGKSKPDSIAIATRTATIGIRGTDFIVETDE